MKLNSSSEVDKRSTNSISKPIAAVPAPNRLKIITDDPTESGALDFPGYADCLSHLIESSKPRFTVGIFGGWGTGKTTLMSMIKNNLDKNKNIVTVWFDAWRYERENDLAVIPFLRTLKLRLDEIERSTKGKWGLVKESVVRTAGAYISSTKLTYGVKDVFTAETDFGKAADSLKGKGDIGDDRGIIYYHATDFLLKALETLRKNDKSYRIVVFVDDLDRCDPDKALEVLQSIKSLFDIEGIIYVIGMNYNSIDNLVKEKYGDALKSGMTGFDYMKKIVQLPFLIPDWSYTDIASFIKSSVLRNLKDSPYYNEFEKYQDIIAKGVEFNPREVKRFFNNILLAKAVFDKPIDRLIVVQALRFRFEWHKLFELLISNKTKFIEAYEQIQKGDSEAQKEMSRIFPDLQEHYPNFFDSSTMLRQFLDRSLGILKEIDNLEEYRRNLVAVSIEEPSSSKLAVLRYIMLLFQDAIDKLEAHTSSEGLEIELVPIAKRLNEARVKFEARSENPEVINETYMTLRTIEMELADFIRKYSELAPHLRELSRVKFALGKIRYLLTEGMVL